MKTLKLTLPDDLLRIEYGLHKIGNQRPYFTVTGSTRDTGGAMHEIILEAAPQLADLIALHLSDEDGVPMHATANGWYWLQGAVPDTTERYHGGNGNPKRTPEQCLAVLAQHLRISLDDAAALTTLTRAEFYTFTAVQQPRWKREAQAAIAAHGLEVPA
jgi:hypothetical protein